MRPARHQNRQRRTTIGEEILGVHFQKTKRRPLLQDGLVMRLTPADADDGVPADAGWLHFFIFALASSAPRPAMVLHVPLATYFHSSADISAFA